MMVSIFVLMLVLGLGATAVGVVVIAIATRKLWLIPAGAAVVLFGLTGIATVASLFVGFTRHSTKAATIEALPQLSRAVSSVSFPMETVVASQPNFAAYSQPDWSINLTWLVIFGVVFVIVLLRSLFGRHHVHGIARAWPVLVVLGFLALWSLVRVNSAHFNARKAREAADVRQQEQRQIAQNKAEAAARKQLLQQHPGANIVAQTSVPPAEPNDIHELMDQFDQPRIPVSPQTPVPPVAPLPVAAPPAPAAPNAPAPAKVVAIMSDAASGKSASISVETTKADTKKLSAAASQKHKKPKGSNSDSAKAATQTVAESKPTKEEQNKESQNQKSAAEKETKSAAEAALAEAEATEPKARPAWVDQGPKRTGNVPREVVATDEYQTIDECYQAADIYLLLKTYQHIQQLAGRPYAEGPLPSLTFRDGAIFGDGQVMSYARGNNYWDQPDNRLQTLRNMGITVDYLRREIVSKESKSNEPREYVETVERTFGPMKKLYLQIEFTPATDRELRRRWESHERSERFAVVGVGAGSLLGFLGFVFALLKIDTWTKGYYTKRLFVGLPLAIIGSMFMLAVFSWLVARS